MIGDQIRMLLESRGMSPTELADRVGTTTQTINNYIYNRTSPNKTHMRKMLDIFNVEIGFVPRGESPLGVLLNVPLLAVISKQIPVTYDLRIGQMEALEMALRAVAEAFVRAIKDGEVGK